MKRFIQGAAIITTPEVPRYDSGRIEPTQGFNTPRAQGLGPEAFGAGIGQGLQQSSKTMFAVASEERAKADRTATIQARTALDQAEVDLLYHPQTGALAKRGKDAFSLEEPTLKSFDEKTAEIEGGLATPEQKSTFKLLAGQRRVEVDKQIQRHVFSEIKTYADEANKASLQSTLENVVRNYQDPERIEQERKFGLAVIMSDTDNKGLPPEVVKAKVASWESMVHKGVIERMSVDNPVKAQEYFDVNRDNIIPTDAVKIEHALKPLVKEVEVNAAADDIFQTNPTASRADLVSAIRERYKGKPWLQEAEAEVRRLYEDRETATKKVKNDAEEAVYSYIARAKLDGRVPKLSDIPGDVWANLAKVNPEKVGKIADEIRSAQEHATDRTRAEQDRRDTKATVDNLTTWGLLKTNPATLRSTNLDALLAQGKISKSQYQDLTTDQLAIRQGKGEHEALLLSNKAAVDGVLHSVGIRDDPKSEGKSERYMKFYDALNNRMKVFELENQRRPKQDEVKTMARGLLAEVSQDVNFWPIDKTVRTFEVDISRVRVPSIDRIEIIRAIRANQLGISHTVPISEEQIRRVYLEKQALSGGKK